MFPLCETVDGGRYATECGTPKGFWGVAIEPEGHMAKICDCMAQLLTEAQINEFVELTDGLENLDAGGVTQLIGLMNGQ